MKKMHLSFLLIWVIAHLLTVCFCQRDPLSPDSSLENDPSSTESSFTPLERDDGWLISTPEEQGLSRQILSSAFKTASRKTYFYSLLVVKNDYLVAEAYFNGQRIDNANHIHSASKSFTSALVGLAVRQGFLSSLDEKMMDFFPEYTSVILESRKYDITIGHLIAMKAGFDWNDEEEDWIDYSTSSNWIEYALRLPLMHDPGEQFHYSTPQTNLLSAIITKATGMSTKAFAENQLFQKISIPIFHWQQDPQGYYTGGHEMYFTPRNMARFGLFYLNHGVYNGEEILSTDWIQSSVQPYADSEWDWGVIENPGYGYGWWTGSIRDYSVYFASGKGGQFIMNIPALNMVVVTTTNALTWSDVWTKTMEAAEIIEDVILADESVP